METVKISEKGKIQSLILPNSLRINSKEVILSKVGDAIIIIPKKKGWKSLIDSLNKFSSDFMSVREQPSPDNRENLN